ncbi:hypothetical protein MMC17_003360 [Xylographa soralifera]|nr:hypothetical protein [Xylographa soralifera]
MLHYVPNIPSLDALLLADPQLEPLLHSSFPTIVPAVLAASMPEELQRLVGVLLDIRAGTGTESGDGDGERGVFRDGAESRPSSGAASTRALARTGRAEAHFAGTFARCVCQAPPATAQQKQDDDGVLSAAETHRVQRALWRIEVCGALARAGLRRHDADGGGADDRVARLVAFLKGMHPWEIEELHCVYDHLERLLGREGDDPRVDGAGRVVSPYALPAPAFCSRAPGQTLRGANVERLVQGLGALWRYLRRTPVRTRMGDRYEYGSSKDEFIMGAIRRLKREQQRFPKFDEWMVSSSTGLWSDNHGTSFANAGWRFFSDVNADKIHSFAYLRQFGFCIWDERRLRSWDVLRYRYGGEMNEQLMGIWYPWASTEERRQIAWNALRALQVMY